MCVLSWSMFRVVEELQVIIQCIFMWVVERIGSIVVFVLYLCFGQCVFVGVIVIIDLCVEIVEEVCDCVFEVVEYILLEQFGIMDDCGFLLFSDDLLIIWEKVFVKIQVWVKGMVMVV